MMKNFLPGLEPYALNLFVTLITNHFISDFSTTNWLAESEKIRWVYSQEQSSDGS